MKKKVLVFLTVGLLLICGLSMADVSGFWTYYVDEGTECAEITGYSGTAARVTIPSTLNGYTVNSIGERVFEANTTMKAITIPETVASIGPYAFSGCSSLQNFTIPSGVEYINEGTFSYCSSLTSVTIPATVKGIANQAFMECTALKSVAIPEGVTTIDYSTFWGCTSLSSVTFPSTITRIESDAFLETALTEIYLPDEITYVEGRSDFDEDAGTFPIGCIIHVNLGSKTSKTLSTAGYMFYGPDDAYYGCRYIDNLLYLVEYRGQEDVINVPEGIEGVAYVFGEYNKMTKVVFPSTLKVIGSEAFKNCSSMTSIEIPSTVTEIGYQAFAGSVVRKITIPDNVQKIGYGAFRDCTSLAQIAFEVTGQTGINEIGNYAFYNTGLRNVTIPKTTTSIGEYAFASCSSLSSVGLPADGSLESIGSGAFQGSGITSLSIPGTITNVGTGAFSGCLSLQSVEVGEGVKTIGNSAFADNSSLKTVILSAGVESIGTSAFANDYALTTVTLGEGLKTIGAYAFLNDGRLAQISIPVGVTDIGERAFEKAISSIEFTLPDTVTSLGEGAFVSSGLSKITLSAGMKTIKESTFESSSLGEIIIPDSITTIGENAFYNCSGLTNLTLSRKLVSIGNGAFTDCSSLTWVELPESMTRLNQIFDGCNSALIVIPDSITYIQGNAFKDVRAVFGSRNNDALKAYDRFGYSDERTFIYSYIDDDGIEDYDILRAVDFISIRQLDKVMLPEDVKVIKSGAFNNADILNLILPDTGLYSIESGAFLDNMNITCSPSSDTEELLIKAGYPDMYGFTYTVDGSDYIVTGYKWENNEAVLPARATKIGNNTFSETYQLKKLSLPDTGITSIGTNAFHSGLQLICTIGSDTYKLLVAAGYAVEQEGYPGLYAIVKNGQLYDAKYYGNERLIDLPSNIVSTSTRHSYIFEMNEYGGYVYDENGNWNYIDTIPEAFPDTTAYRTTFDSQTALTLAHAGYYITVKGYESFGFRTNYSIDDESGMEMGNTLWYGSDGYSEGTGEDDWFLCYFYESDNGITLPDYPWVALGDMPDTLMNIYLDDSTTIVADKDTSTHKIFVNPQDKILVNGELRTDNNVYYYPTNYPEYACHIQGNNHYDYPRYGDGLVLIKYEGNAKRIKAEKEVPYCGVVQGAFPSDVFFYIEGYEEFLLQYTSFGRTGQERYGLAIVGYNGDSLELFLDDELAMYIDGITENAFAADIKLYCDPMGSIPSFFYGMDRYFYQEGYPDFALSYGPTLAKYVGSDLYAVLSTELKFRYIDEDAFEPDITILADPADRRLAAEYFSKHTFRAIEDMNFEYHFGIYNINDMSDEITLIAYHGDEEDISIPNGTQRIRDGAIPKSVKSVHLDNYLCEDQSYWPDDLVNDTFKLFVEIDSQFVQLAKRGQYIFNNHFYTKAYPDVAYVLGYVDNDSVYGIGLAAYTGSSKEVHLPGYYSYFSNEILNEYYVTSYYPDDPTAGKWKDGKFYPFGDVDIYVYSNTQTAALLDKYNVPYNVRQTVESTLPASLTIIEEEAFANSSFEEVTIGSKCTTIEARAFADSTDLVIVHIPANVTSIESTAFTGCSQVTIYCKRGSAAETFAKNSGIPYKNE